MDKYLITINEEYGEGLGLDLISYVKNPAVKVKGFAFNEMKMKFADDTKMRIIAPALIPMEIYRYDIEDGYEYFVEFTAEVIEQIRGKFMKNLTNKNIFNLEHSEEIVPAHILETWIVGKDPKLDRAFSEFGIEVPSGTMMVMSQITDQDYYNKIVENDQVAYSIEGFFGFTDKQIEDIKMKQQFEDTFNDYPQAASDNAQRALDWAEENGWGSCGTGVGKARANQLAKRESISRDTIARMSGFERHRSSSDGELGEGCGKLMWLAWGGDEGIAWAKRKLEEIDSNKNKKTNMELVLPNGEHLIGDKIYVVEDGKVIEIKDKVEEVITEEVVEEKVEEVVAEVEVKEEEEIVAEEVIEEDKVKMAIDETELMTILQPKFDEIYKMIADIKSVMEVEDEVEEVTEVKMSVAQKFSSVMDFVKEK